MSSRIGQQIVRFLLLCFIAFSVIAEDADPDVIYNYHKINDTLSTAGQLLPVHVAKLQRENFQLVINLAVADKARNLDESYKITHAGINYVQIPVVWDTPTLDDLDLFFSMMDARGERKTLVHCFANYRASAFTYLYRVLKEGVPEADARKDMMQIWSDDAFTKYPQWRAFIDKALVNGA